MIKYLKHIFVAAIAMIAVTGCQEDMADAFSTAPVAPVLTNNGAILLTENTLSEDIVWAWQAARFLKGEVSYALYVQYAEETAKQVGTSTKELTISMTKPEFHTLVSGFQSIPENSTFSLEFYVVATDDEGPYTSEKETVRVYSYGDAVSPVVAAEQTSIVLDITDPTAELLLLTWTEARMVYGEAITYGVYMSYDDGELVEVAKDLTELTCAKTVDEWNELAVSAGAPEAEASDIQFTVMAFSESYPDGIPSAEVTINITTYIATYPDQLYVPGSHQGWAPADAIAIPHSTLTKGLFECYMDLTTSDGSDVEFKFNPDKAWDGNDFGIDGEAEVSTDASGNLIVTGKLGGSNKNVVAPSGFYRISVNRKLNTIEMLKVESMGLIGDATVGGWGAETPMDYDAESNTYSLVTTMKAGEYKFRANDNWDYAIGVDGTFSGDNYTFDKEEDLYKIILDVNKHPYSVKVLSTKFPEKLYLPGSHQGWSPASAPTLEGNGEGFYEGGVNLVDTGGDAICAWKFSPEPDWGKDFAGTITLDGNGYGEGTYGGGGNILVPSGYYYIKVDMTEGTFEMQRIDKVGLIGGFNGWDGDEDFVYNANADVWSLTYSLTAGEGFKVRFNAGWDMNRGPSASGIVPTGAAVPVYNDGGDMQVATDGAYTIILDMTTNPNTIRFSK